MDACPPDRPASAEYVARVNRAIDHVVRHLDGPLRLEDVAAVAGFSPFHFHRIFKAILGETLQHFVKRQRLERALYLMSHAPQQSLTEIALDCGFSSSSDFSRSFRQQYGVAPRAFDLEAFRNERRREFERAMARDVALKDGARPQAGRADVATPNLARGRTAYTDHAAATARIFALSPGENPDGFAVTVRDLPARTVAYLRVLDPFRPGVAQAACERLLAWAIERGFADGQWLGYMWDEPEVVALADCRYDVAVVVGSGIDVRAAEAEAHRFAPAGEIGRLTFPPMRVAEVVIRGDLALEARALDWLYRTWLPASGYVPDDHPGFEAWIGRPFAHGTEHFEIACQLPVRPA